MSLKNPVNPELPYERFARFGAESLTEAELLAIILRTGTRDQNAVEVAKQILAMAQYPRLGLLGLYDLNLEDLQSIKGIGPVKATKLKCLTELSLRISRSKAQVGICFRNPQTVAAYFMEQLRHNDTECVMLVCLDTKGQMIASRKLSEGSVKMSLISPREIFLEALGCKAVSILLVHNHPSGDPTPSRSDIDLTENVKELAEKLDIPLLDHIIIGDNRYSSFKEAGYL